MDQITINTTNDGGEMSNVVFETLNIRDQMHNMDNKARLTKLIQAYTILYDMLENDSKELEEVANIARPIDIVFTKATVVNPEEVKNHYS